MNIKNWLSKYFLKFQLGLQDFFVNQSWSTLPTTQGCNLNTFGLDVLKTCLHLVRDKNNNGME